MWFHWGRYGPYRRLRTELISLGKTLEENGEEGRLSSYSARRSEDERRLQSD